MERWLGGVFLVALTLSSLAQGQERPPKKLIEYGWDVPYPDFLQEHLQEMEQRPFDGIIFRLRDYNHAFDPRPWEEAKLQPQWEALKSLEWRTFTDNFLCLYAANHWGMDWFNDEQWRTIAANLRLTARSARLGRCVGICFDPEPYGPNPWAYPGPYRDRPFAEVAAQVRRRGAQFIQALQEELPQLRLLTFFQLSLFPSLVDEPDPRRREERLAQHGYALLPAFLNGMLDAAAPGVRIIDGNEPAYYYTNAEAYFRAYHLMKQRALTLVAPENRPKYVAQVQAGMALYMDHVLALREPPERFLSFHLSPQERLRWFEHNVYYALLTSDEYVWCYSERMDWWGVQAKAPWARFVPEGAEEALRSARGKIARGEPLGFDIADLIASAQRRMEALLSARLIQRTALLQPLGPGEKPPRIDGLLDEALWRNRPPLEPFLPNAASFKEKPEAATWAWVAYDDTHLYIAFRCEEPQPARMSLVGKRRDDEIWRGDVVEVFVSLGEAPLPYRHFIVNPRNLQWDGQSGPEGDDRSWDAPWQSAVHVGEKEWTVEMAIPWEALGGRPQPGSRRRANLCRQRTPVRELSTWSAVNQGFVEPERCGVWEFGK